MVIFVRLFKITQLRCWVICTSVLFVVWSWTYTLSTTPDHLVCFLWFCSVGSDATQKLSVDFNITATRLRLVMAVHQYYVCLFWFDNFIRPSATLLGYLYCTSVLLSFWSWMHMLSQPPDDLVSWHFPTTRCYFFIFQPRGWERCLHQLANYFVIDFWVNVYPTKDPFK